MSAHVYIRKSAYTLEQLCLWTGQQQTVMFLNQRNTTENFVYSAYMSRLDSEIMITEFPMKQDNPKH